MHSSLAFIPEPLLQHLGAYSRLDDLISVPQITIPLHDLRQHKGSEPYHVKIAEHGLTLTLQCINPTASAEQQFWGLLGISLDSSTWSGNWPVEIDPLEATASQLITLFLPNEEETMNMHPMLCFGVEGLSSQTWSITAIFNATTRKLRTLSLTRVGDWRMLDAPLNAPMAS